MFNDVNDDGKLKMRFNNKKSNARKEGIGFFLTKEQFFILVAMAGLVSSDLGFSSGNNFVLARYNDEGDYTFENCRFITQKENAAEKKITDRSRSASSRNISAVNASRGKEERTRISILGRTKRKDLAKKRREEYEKRANKSYLGKNNSQYGTRWVTNGCYDIKIKSSEKIPVGFKMGRTHCFLGRSSVG